jgi:hypothetical protein
MDRIVNKARDFQEAEKWDILQQVRMTPQERLEAAEVLKKRVFGHDQKDVREWHGRR